jgi:hypothetical protein
MDVHWKTEKSRYVSKTCSFCNQTALLFNLSNATNEIPRSETLVKETAFSDVRENTLIYRYFHYVI